MRHQADDAALRVGVLSALRKVAHYLLEVLSVHFDSWNSILDYFRRVLNKRVLVVLKVYLRAQVVRGVRVDEDAEEHLLEQLPERVRVAVGPTARRHAVDLVDVDDEAQAARVLVHRVGLRPEKSKRN